MKSIVITVDEQHVEEMDRIIVECENAGMVIQDKLELLGQICGEISEKNQPRIRSIKGIMSVEESGSFEIPPPDSDVQ